MNSKIAFSIGIVVVAFFSMWSGLDTSSMQIHDDAFERAFGAFAIAKALNAVISLIQGTELSFTPIGVGLTFSVGEILDPLNDLVERFSMIMLLSTISLGIEKLLLTLSFSTFIKVALTLSTLGLVVLIWLKKAPTSFLFSLMMRLFLLLVLLRYAAIIFVSFETMFYNSMLKDEFTNSTLILEKTHKELKHIESASEKIQMSGAKDSSWYSASSDKYTQVIEKMNIQQKLEDLEESIDEATENIINLATIFIVLSMILPMLFLWLVYALIKVLFSRSLEFKSLEKSLLERPVV